MPADPPNANDAGKQSRLNFIQKTFESEIGVKVMDAAPVVTK